MSGKQYSLTQNSQSVPYAINGLGQRIRKYGSEDSQEGDVNGDGFVNQQDVFSIQKINEGSANDGPVTHCNNNDSDSEADETCVQNVVDSGDSRELPFSARVRFAYNQQGQLVGDYDEYGNPIQEIVWFAGQPVALIQDDDMYYVHTDHLGTPRAVVDDNNEVVWQWKSDPFGVARANEDVDGDGERFVTHLRFTGQYYDVESGLHYNVNRTYDPVTGRYIESDPIGLVAGLNTYGYVGGNPVNSMDPSGLIKYGDLGFAVVDFSLSVLEVEAGAMAIIGSPLTGPFAPATVTGGGLVAAHGLVGVYNSGNAIIDALTETKSQGLFESVGAVFGPTGQKIGQGVDLFSGIRPGAVTGNLYDLANGTNTMINAFGNNANNANSTSGNAGNPQSTIIDNGYQCSKL